MTQQRSVATMPTPAEMAILEQLRAMNGGRQGGGNQKIRMDPAKAAAFDAWTSQSGGVRKRGSREGAYREEFRRGPMKGMTREEAMQRFEKMWETASPDVKAKYERRATDSSAPVSGNAALNTMSAADAQKARMKGYGYEMRDGQAVKVGTPVAKPYDKDGNNVPDSIQRPASPPSPGNDQSQAAMGTPEQQTAVRQMMGEGQDFATAGTGDAGMKAAVAMEAKPDGYKFGYDFRKDMEAAANGIHGRGFAPNAAPAPAATTVTPPPTLVSPTPSAPATRYPVGQGRVGGTSVSAQQGRISTGASPSAPVEQRQQVAESAAVRPVMPDQVGAAVASAPKAIPAPTTATRPPRIGETPAGQELVGMKSGVPQYAPASPTPVARPTDIAAADSAMRSQGMVVRTPVQRPATPARPAGRSDGYQARSLEESARMEREAAAARQSGTMGNYFTGQGKPEMAKAFPNRTANPPGLVAKPPVTLQSPFGAIRKPVTSIRPAFRR